MGKICTSIEQSKRLLELGLESNTADMCYSQDDGLVFVAYKSIAQEDKHEYIPCWSLSALLDVLPKKYYPIKDHETDLILGKPKDKWCILYWDTTGMQDGEQTLADNPVDACYEMILKLHELKML